MWLLKPYGLKFSQEAVDELEIIICFHAHPICRRTTVCPPHLQYITVKDIVRLTLAELFLPVLNNCLVLPSVQRCTAISDFQTAVSVVLMIAVQSILLMRGMCVFAVHMSFVWGLSSQRPLPRKCVSPSFPSHIIPRWSCCGDGSFYLYYVAQHRSHRCGAYHWALVSFPTWIKQVHMLVPYPD